MTQKKVLIVDDSKLMRIIIKKILSTDDIFIVTGEAGNGIEALAEIEKDIPDIIFLDIEMPEMDGVEALKEIRAKYSTKVVVVSSVAQMGSSRAAEVNQLGADAIIVSNHGGRQLDQTSSTISMLPKIVKAVKGKSAIWLDGGIRSGQDILKAVALGADNTLIGRAMSYGLAANGISGCEKTLNILHTELDMTMALCGHKNLKEVDDSILKIESDF